MQAATGKSKARKLPHTIILLLCYWYNCTSSHILFLPSGKTHLQLQNNALAMQHQATVQHAVLDVLYQEHVSDHLACVQAENTRTIRFYQLPNIMVVLFPRHAIYGGKLNDPMTVPQQLNMRKWVHETSPELAQGVSLDYDLQSIVTHHGRSSTGGHCTATCFHGPQPGAMHFCAIRQYAYFPHQC